MKIPAPRIPERKPLPQTDSIAKPRKLAPPPDSTPKHHDGHDHPHAPHAPIPTPPAAAPALQRDLAGAPAPQGFAQTPATQARSRTAAASAKSGFDAPNITLKEGAKGRHVETLQGRLKKLGFDPGPIDGDFGPKTEKAVKSFQRDAGEHVDGIVGPKTWAALEKAKPNTPHPPTPPTPPTQPTPPSAPKDGFDAPDVTLQEGAKGRHVETLQGRLKKLGFNPGPVDGAFGPMTENAVRDFQRDAGLPVNGNVGPKTWAALEKGKEVLQNPDTPLSRFEQFDQKPPTADYSHVNFRGATMNKRTVEMLRRAEEIMEKKHGHENFQFSFSQGSYNPGGVSGSAGTHDGGGALDIRTVMHSRGVVDDMVRSLRQAGFAAWSRGRGHDTFSPHIHAIAIGDRDLSRSARSQVSEYGWGGDGLSGSRPDADRDLGRPIPSWAKRYL